MLSVRRSVPKSVNSGRKTGEAEGSRPTISDYLRRFAVSGLSWPLPMDMSDAAIDARPAALDHSPEHPPYAC